MYVIAFFCDVAKFMQLKISQLLLRTSNFCSKFTKNLNKRLESITTLDDTLNQDSQHLFANNESSSYEIPESILDLNHTGEGVDLSKLLDSSNIDKSIIIMDGA